MGSISQISSSGDGGGAFILNKSRDFSRIFKLQPDLDIEPDKIYEFGIEIQKVFFLRNDLVLLNTYEGSSLIFDVKDGIIKSQFERKEVFSALLHNDQQLVATSDGIEEFFEESLRMLCESKVVGSKMVATNEGVLVMTLLPHEVQWVTFPTGTVLKDVKTDGKEVRDFDIVSRLDS